MDTFFLGPLGSMQPVEVSKNLPISTQRGSSELITSGGVRYVQQGRRAPRSWVFSHNWQEPRWAKLLSLAAHGMLTDCWLYDVAAARENMLPATSSLGTGAPVPVEGISMGTLPAGHQVQVPVLAGRLYTVSGWTLNAGTVLTASCSGVNITVEAVAGLAEASFTPTSDSILTVIVPQSGLSGLRVHDGAPDGRFMPGHGTPCKVAVQDPAQTLRLVTDRTYSDYEVTIYEVGKPGLI